MQPIVDWLEKLEVLIAGWSRRFSGGEAGAPASGCLGLPTPAPLVEPQRRNALPRNKPVPITGAGLHHFWDLSRLRAPKETTSQAER
jgi:hypothetical protein